jgi:hypothetical protein
MAQTASTSRRNRRYLTLVLLVGVLIAGWSWFWDYASGKIAVTLEGWRAREAASGRIYACGNQSVGGYPFRFEVDCQQASALFQSGQTPLQLRAGGVLVAAQVYDPTLVIAEYHGPLAIGGPDLPADFVVNWKLAQSSVRGTPAAPERADLVLDKPAVDRVTGGVPQALLRAGHAELHGRLVGGSVKDNPVIELALQVDGLTAAAVYPAAAAPVDGDILFVLRGLKDFSPKPWAARFRELQNADGRIEIEKARVRQGETLAVGSGMLSLNADGRLEGQLQVTVAGLEQFLALIGAQQMVQSSPAMDKLSGALDRLSPGLGNMARQQIGANISAGINLIGEQTTLEGKRAVTLPLRASNGRMFLGPVPLGDAPALF